MLSKHLWPNNVLAAYFCKIASGWPPAVQCLSFSWLAAGCQFHSVNHQPDTNFLQLATSRMQISLSRPPVRCKLHPASGHTIQSTQISNSLHMVGDQLKEICIQLVAISG